MGVLISLLVVGYNHPNKDLLKKKLTAGKTIPLKPIIMHGNHADREPLIIDVHTILENLDSTGDLKKNSLFLTSLLIAQFDEGQILVNYAYGFSNTTGKCYFYKEGNFDRAIDAISFDENLNETNLPSRKVFLSYLPQLMNSLSGSIWLNGFCVNGPSSPKDRISFESIKVRSIPARLTISVKELSGIHCIRTKSRLEIYAKTKEGDTKSIWFRGDYATSLIVTEVEDDLMSILVPPYSEAYVEDEDCLENLN
ncbi:unnamed protein product [Allacma fusca]|uniref:Uncharacterized protein n=1 Tax=Allacma fusca TaxID=39272 RepID=A0A8J2P331_9HEXA|nr:unnamed protein product [Allacma fusca]